MAVNFNNANGFVGSATGFITAYKAWLAGGPDAGENLYLASQGLASSLSTLVASNPALETEFSALGVPSAIQSYINDVNQISNAPDSTAEFSAILGAAADGSAAIAGLGTVAATAANVELTGLAQMLQLKSPQLRQPTE